MFGFGGSRITHPQIYNGEQVSNKHMRTYSSPPPGETAFSSTESFEPAIEGPPSPEQIRKYTEQMKRSSIFGNNSRTNTLSSATSSSRSRESLSTSTESSGLSRKSSSRSNASNMPSSRLERPDSVQIFGRTLFSRRGRRGTSQDNDRLGFARVAANIRDGRPLTSGSRSSLVPEEHRPRHNISEPYNFQHVTHTGQDHLRNLDKASQKELVSEFSAIRASQIPLQGGLKGIHAQDLHFDNFSSEATEPQVSREQFPSRQQSILRKPVAPQSQRPVLNYAKSYDNFRSTPPTRPPRSPVASDYPVILPARTSSRTASVLFDTFDLLATTTLSRPQTHGGFRNPTPFAIPPPPPPPPQWNEETEDFTTRPFSHTASTLADAEWPLSAATPGKYGGELTDVQEEDEELVKSGSRLSTASGDLRSSKSVPVLRHRSVNQHSGSDDPMAVTVLHRTTALRPLSPGFDFMDDTWDNAIDYAYDHEAEADCDYNWDSRSADDSATVVEGSTTFVEQPELDFHLDDERRVYPGRFRQSLLVPSAFDLPELSPISIASTTSDPQTPSNLLHPGHIRSHSHASSFRESQGFHLSPSLLIPSDFQSEMEQDSLYEEHYSNHNVSKTMFEREHYAHSQSSVDDGLSSTASYRSSDFSRRSARSSSSTRISHKSPRSSQDSATLLSRAASINQAHRSVCSASSLPDLVPSALSTNDHVLDMDLFHSIGNLSIEEKSVKMTSSEPTSKPASPLQTAASSSHRRNKSVVRDAVARKDISQSALPLPEMPWVESEQSKLSPVAESFIDNPTAPMTAHGRKTSAPVASMNVKEFKGRARSATSGTPRSPGIKQRGSYMLFPQV